MRAGKKPNIVEAKNTNTRSCFVRLEKVRPQPGKTTTAKNITIKNSSKMPLPQTERTTKGPLKKRPITDNIPPSRMRDKARVSKETPEPQSPPTIAAGRSRRAIKPNPKYTSEDMVTPKIIKNASLAASGSKRQRKHSSSSDDFFNKESSDELGANEIDEVVDKAFEVAMKDMDSDFSEEEVVVQETRLPPRRRGRPSKADKILWDNLRKKLNAAQSTTPKPVKVVPSPLQQIRKSMITSNTKKVIEIGSSVQKRPAEVALNIKPATNINVSSKQTIEIPLQRRTIEMASTRKRKLGGSDNENLVTRKRFFLTPIGNHQKPTIKDSSGLLQVNHRNLSNQKNANLSLNGKDDSKTEQKEEKTVQISQEPKKLLTVPKVLTKPAPKLPTLNKSLNARLLTLEKLRSSSPKTATVKDTESKDDENEEKVDGNKSTDDFESMPTFTIVNINDIINKKGDVLISKTVSKNSSQKLQKIEENKLTTIASDTKLTRSKVNQLGSNLEKNDTEQSKSALLRSSLVAKKPTQTILNHTLLNKASPNGSNYRTARSSLTSLKDITASRKPAPRILNSMVAKKMLPVKPMITNMDDSADESYALSLDEEEEDIDGDDNNFEAKQRRLSYSLDYSLKPKQGESVTKENSLQKSLSTKSLQRKTSPEKVVISRDGDKIIKKITCYETWYVIDIATDKTDKTDKNLLELPLIELANNVKDIKLPSKLWKNKITLSELTPIALAKSTLVTYTGDITEQGIAEENRTRYQPSCVMFRRATEVQSNLRMQYDRAVIFKDKSFHINIDGKNVRLLGAPQSVGSQEDVEILLDTINSLTINSELVELITAMP